MYDHRLEIKGSKCMYVNAYNTHPYHMKYRKTDSHFDQCTTTCMITAHKKIMKNVHVRYICTLNGRWTPRSWQRALVHAPAAITSCFV